MKEVDLYNPVKKFLLDNGCSNVYGEVLDCDVLGVDGSLDIIVELKTNLSFKLLDQVIERKHLGHYNYIAIPERKTPIPRCARELLLTHKIGLLEIIGEKDGYFDVYVSIPARYNRLANTSKQKGYGNIRKHIKDYNLAQPGGVKSGEAVTDYSVTIKRIKHYLLYRKGGKWTTLDEILEHCETHYVNPKPSVAATLKAKWNENWCEIKVMNGIRYYRCKKED